MEAEGSPSQKSEPKSTKDAAKPSSKRGLSETQLPDKNCGTAKKSRFFEYQGPIRRSRRLYEKSLVWLTTPLTFTKVVRQHLH